MTNLSAAQTLALQIKSVDPLTMAEKMFPERSPSDQATTAMLIDFAKSQALEEVTKDIVDFQFGDSLARRAEILLANGFSKLRVLPVVPHEEEKETIIGKAHSCKLHVWIKKEIGAVYVLGSHVRVASDGSAHEYIGHGDLHLRVAPHDQAVPLGISFSGGHDSVEYGHSWPIAREFDLDLTNSTERKQPSDLYLRGSLCGDQLLLAKLAALLDWGTPFPVWPALEGKYHDIHSMFIHTLEYGRTSFKDHELRSFLSRKRAESLGGDLLSILNYQPDWLPEFRSAPPTK